MFRALTRSVCLPLTYASACLMRLCSLPKENDSLRRATHRRLEGAVTWAGSTVCPTPSVDGADGAAAALPHGWASAWYHIFASQSTPEAGAGHSKAGGEPCKHSHADDEEGLT